MSYLHCSMFVDYCLNDSLLLKDSIFCSNVDIFVLFLFWQGSPERVFVCC